MKLNKDWFEKNPLYNSILKNCSGMIEKIKLNSVEFIEV